MYSKYSFIYFYGDPRQSCKDAYEEALIAPEKSLQIDGSYLSKDEIFNSSHNEWLLLLRQHRCILEQ